MARSTSFTLPTYDASEGYPVQEWSTQRTRYSEYWNHFDGDWLDDTIGADSTALKYPLQLNPYKMVCLLHTAYLYGEQPDSSAPLVTTVIEPWGQGSSAEAKDLAQRATDLVNRVWEESAGRSLQQEGGLITQVMGGAAYGVTYDPDRAKFGQLPIRIEHVLPEHFFPVWAEWDYHNLIEAIIAFQTTKLQARELYGITSITEGVVEPLVQYHWRRDRYEVTVDGNVGKWGGVDLEGPNPTGLVPYVYIPHGVREGKFYGTSLLRRKLELAKEINARYGDIGNIIQENAKALPAIVNAGSVTARKLRSGHQYLDIKPSMPNVEARIHYPASVQTNAASIQWASELLSTARIEAFTPPVCYGLDEGSQRSALTLAFRMLPLLAHVRAERTSWTEGVSHIAYHILRLAAAKKLDERLTPEKVGQLRIWLDWAPILPRDREQEVNEIILRVNNNLLPIETALERLGDIRDVKTALNLIREWMEYQAQLGALGGNDPFAGAGTRGELAGLEKPTPPQANIRKED